MVSLTTEFGASEDLNNFKVRNAINFPIYYVLPKHYDFADCKKGLAGSSLERRMKKDE